MPWTSHPRWGSAESSRRRTPTRRCRAAARRSSRRGEPVRPSCRRRRRRPAPGPRETVSRSAFRPLVALDLAVAQVDLAAGVRRDVVLVGYQEDRLALVVQLLEQPHDLLARRRVEVPSGLVGEQDARLVHERPGDRHPLPLPPRQLVRLVHHAVAEPHALQRPRGLLAACLRRHARVDQRQLHVVERGGARQQVERLEDEPDFLVADARQLVVGEVAHLLAVEPVLARGGSVEAADEVHEGRLPRSRRAHHGHVLVLADLEAHAPQRAHDLAAHVVVAGELVREDHDVRLWRVAGAELLEVGHAYFFFLVLSAACFIGRTRALSFRSRIDWEGPATIVSPSFPPSATSKNSSPAIPTFPGWKAATPFATTKTPSASRFLRAKALVSTGRFSVEITLFSRTVRAMMGIDSTCLRVSVTTRAVAERSGRTSPGGWLRVISTS